MDLSKPGLSDTPYALFVRNTASIFYLDGAFISDVNGKVCFTKFFLDHALATFIVDTIITCMYSWQNLS